MFGIGDDNDDDKLKKNMREIKEMIEGKEQEATGTSQQPVEQQTPQDTNMPINESQKPSRQNEQVTDAQRPQMDTAEPQEQESTKKTSSNFDNNTEKPVDQYKSPQSGLEGVSSGQKEKPEPDTTSDKPKSEGSQLFIRKQRFRQVMNTISEMQQLTNEMKRLTGDLETGLEKDKKTAQDLRNLSDNFSDRTNKVRDEVSPE